MMKRNYILFVMLSLILLVVSARLLPHLPNLTPVSAIAFVSSIYLGKRWSILLPLSALLLSDMLIGFYDWKIMIAVYGSFALVGLLSWISRKYRDTSSVVFLIIASSLLFFLITNAAVWAFSPWYEKSLSGLLYAYELGLPFLRNMLLGDIVYSFVLLKAFALVLSYGDVIVSFARILLEKKG